MTPRERGAKTYGELLAWAEATHGQAGNPYHIVNSHGEPWNYATSFIDYAEGEAIGAFRVGTDEAVLFILFTAAILWESLDAPSA